MDTLHQQAVRAAHVQERAGPVDGLHDHASRVLPVLGRAGMARAALGRGQRRGTRGRRARRSRRTSPDRRVPRSRRRRRSPPPRARRPPSRPRATRPRPEGSDRSRLYTRPRARPRLRAREPEGRRRQDDHGAQPRRCLAEAGERALVVDLDPQANATSGLGERANGVSSYDLLDGADVLQVAAADALPEPRPRPCKQELAGARLSSPLTRTASGTSPSRSPARPSATASSSSIALRASAADRQRARGRGPGDRPGAGRVLRARGPLAALRLDQPVKARLNDRLAVAGILLTMVDGRTRLAADVEGRCGGTSASWSLDVRAPLGTSRRGAEPRPAI